MNDKTMRELYSGDDEILETEKSYEEVLNEVQQYFSNNHSEFFNEENLSDEEFEHLQKSQIGKYLSEHKNQLGAEENIVDRIYNDMAGFGVLHDLIYDGKTKKPHEGLEEINVNSWEDIEVVYNGKPPQKTHVKFNSPQEAKNMFDRILAMNGQKIDTMTPTAVSYLPWGIRVCVNQYPIVVKSDGIAASIRIVTPNLLSTEKIIKENIASAEMMELISLLHTNGISIAISGGTSTGKTTFLSALLQDVGDGNRIIIIEENTKEINIVKRAPDGWITNNVVSMITRPHHDPQFNITASKLIERSLTMNPKYIIIAEMKGEESVIAAEAAITGQVCMTTIHANEAYLAYTRMADLALKKYPMPKEHLMMQMTQAFPVVIQLEQGKDYKRRVEEVVEAVGVENGQPIIKPLFRYDYETDSYIKTSTISVHLQSVLYKKGVSKNTMEKFLK